MEIEWQLIGLLFTAGVAAGMTNAVAGGGSFFTFPAFLAAGLPPIVANATNAIAVTPSHFFASLGYRNELRKTKFLRYPTVIVAGLGAIAGALLAITISNKIFARFIPFLILFATMLFMFGQKLSGRISADSIGDASLMKFRVDFLLVFEFMVAFYGGFFRAGLGVLLMAYLLVIGVHDMQENNALKNLLASIIACAAVAVYLFSGLVSWAHMTIVLVGTAIGGALGVRLAKVLSGIWLRRIVIIVGFFLSGYYFKQFYL